MDNEELNESTTIRINKADKETWDEFLLRTRTSGVEAFHQFMKELKLLLDLMSPNKKLLFMFEFNTHGSNRWVILRLSDALCSSWDEIPVELRGDILKAFRYDENFNEINSDDKESEKK